MNTSAMPTAALIGAPTDVGASDRGASNRGLRVLDHSNMQKLINADLVRFRKSTRIGVHDAPVFMRFCESALLMTAKGLGKRSNRDLGAAVEAPDTPERSPMN